MADQTSKYTIVYDASSAVKAARDVGQLTSSVTTCDAAVTRSRKNFSGFAAGASRSASAATPKIKDLGAALDGVAARANNAKASLNGIGAGVRTATAGVGKFLAAAEGLRVAEAVFQALDKALADANHKLDELAEKALKTRDAMRELANLQGHDSPDDAVVGGGLLLGMAAGMPGDESRQFLEQFEGSIPAGRQKGNVLGKVGEDGLTREAQEKFEKELAVVGAQFTARVGLDAKTGGDLSGVVAQYTKLDSVEDLAGQLGAMAWGLNEGRGKISDLARSELGAAGNMIGSGHAKDLAELGSFVGVASTVAKGAGSSGTKVNQMDALLNTGEGKKGYEYLKKIGATEQSSDLEKLRLVRADLVKNGGAHWDTYLGQQGFGNETEIRATVAMAQNFDVLDQRVKRAREEAKNGGTVIEANRKFIGTSVTGANRQAEAAMAAAEFVQGTEGEHLVVARKFAESRLRARDPDDPRGTIDTPDSNWWDNLSDLMRDNQLTRVTGAKHFLMGGDRTAREDRIDREARTSFVQSLKDTGLIGQDVSNDRAISADPRSAQVDAKYPGLLRGDDTNLRRAMHDLAPQVIARGGNPYGGMEEVVRAVKENTEQAKKTNELLQRNMRGGRPDPVAPAGGGPVGPFRP